jgi:uncharacterized protein (DUF58 family)
MNAAMNALFDQTFLMAIARLSLAIKAAPPRAAVGMHLSARQGASLEFRDYQPYTPGDDLRRVDWAVYRRTHHLFVRRFERPTAVPVTILVDASGSMMLEQPTRYRTAARVAAAIASAALNSHNPVRLLIGGASGTPRALVGRRGLVRMLADLAAVENATPIGIATALHNMAPTLASAGRSVVVVISDFLESAGIDVLLDALRLTPGRLVLIRITRPQDERPDLSGDLELIDCEGSARRFIAADTKSLARYHSVYRAYFGALRDYCTSRGAPLFDIDATGDTLPQLGRLFTGGIFSI